MRLLLSKLLPNCTFRYSFRNSMFPFLWIRPTKGACLIRCNNVSIRHDSLTSSTSIHADTITIFLTHNTKIVCTSVVYTIHSTITIESIQCTVGSFPVSIQSFQCLFQTPIQFSLSSLSFLHYASIQRFDRTIPITFSLSKPYILRIPEIRIFHRPSVTTLTQWKHDISLWIPNEETNDPLPEIHLSSLFIRYMPTQWYRCLSPISIGSSFKHVWDIWEHVVRAVLHI